jgi:meso-butanediol dehydrogenase/(S,S)-butanediol dehydrogenase/diacetyl reductase
MGTNRLLEGKAAVVTGAASGIGAASALRFAAEGARVVVADIRPAKAAAIASDIVSRGGEADVFEVDVQNAESVQRMIEHCVQRYGGIDVLFNNAGTLRPGPAEELSVADWDFVMGVNVRSVFLGAKFAVPHMRRQGGGSIINTASISGLDGEAGSVVYSASKAAVINLTRALSTDHAAEGIRVNAICPGTIETPPVSRALADPAIRATYIAAHSVRRLGRPDEIANAAVWLASDQASFVTGHALVVDGGFTSQSPVSRLPDPRPTHLRGQG